MTTPSHYPFSEPDGYVDGLISRATEHALQQGGSDAKPVRGRSLRLAIASVAAMLVMIASFTYVARHPQAAPEAPTSPSQHPLDDFLNSLSDREAQQLPYYYIEEIPAY